MSRAASAGPGGWAGVDAFVSLIRHDDVASARSVLRAAAITLGPKTFVTDVAHPIATRVGDEWALGGLEVRQEHLVTSMLTGQLRILLAAHEGSEAAPVVVLATLPGEQHVLGLEMVAVYLAAHGATPRLLGASTPPDQIARAARAMNAHVVGISVTYGGDPRDIDVLRRALRGRAELWVGGGAAADVTATRPKLKLRVSWSEIDAALESFRASRA